MTFTDSTGNLKNWEYVTRSTKRGAEADGVSILATIRHNGNLHLIANAIFRYPVSKYILEFPAGLIDKEDSDCVNSALRELKEETGYIARREDVTEIGEISYNDPWKSDECTQIVKISVNADLEENKNPVQELEPSEQIKVELIPVKDMLKHMLELCKQKDYLLDARLYSLAHGLELSKLI